ncbi:hypothetical protein PTKIN_Ptkin03bG0170800 [Pterospermum kingtungense]
MEVLVGSTFGIEVAASTKTYVRDRPQPQPQPQEKVSSSCLFLKEQEDDVGGHDSTTGSNRVSPDLSSDSSSSIGSPGDTDDEEEEGGVVSSGGSGVFASLDSLEDSLPVKRGLSNHYAGKSKSFANLSEVSSIKELPKAENALNKRRRVLIANKLYGKSSFYCWKNPNSMPLLALNEEEDGQYKETPSSSSASSNDKLSVTTETKPKLQQSRLKATLKSQSCFSLTDLQVEHE